MNPGNRENKNEEPWYGAKCIFLHTATESCQRQVYEERVILVRANDFDEAIRRAEQEAETYARDCGSCTYTGFIDVFHIYDGYLGDGTEVYSLMRTSDCGTDEYLTRFYDTEAERTRKQP